MLCVADEAYCKKRVGPFDAAYCTDVTALMQSAGSRTGTCVCQGIRVTPSRTRWKEGAPISMSMQRAAGYSIKAIKKKTKKEYCFCFFRSSVSSFRWFCDENTKIAAAEITPAVFFPVLSLPAHFFHFTNEGFRPFFFSTLPVFFDGEPFQIRYSQGCFFNALAFFFCFLYADLLFFFFIDDDDIFSFFLFDVVAILPYFSYFASTVANVQSQKEKSGAVFALLTDFLTICCCSCLNGRKNGRQERKKERIVSTRGKRTSQTLCFTSTLLE